MNGSTVGQGPDIGKSVTDIIELLSFSIVPDLINFFEVPYNPEKTEKSTPVKILSIFLLELSKLIIHFNSKNIVISTTFRLEIHFIQKNFLRRAKSGIEVYKLRINCNSKAYNFSGELDNNLKLW